MNPIYDFEDIDDYLHDRMSESDQRTFEQALETDADLTQRVEALRAETKVFRLLQEEHLFEQFAAWEKEEEDQKKNTLTPTLSSGGAKVVSIYRRWLIPVAAAATLAGIIATGITLGWFRSSADEPAIVKTAPVISEDTAKKPTPALQPETPTNIAVENPALPPDKAAAFYAALGKTNYMDEDFSGTLMGAGHEEDTANNYTKAVKLYGAGQYKAALKLLERPDSTQLQENLYLRGYTYYQLKQYAKAEQDFRMFRTFRISDRKVDAIWCEVFCLIQQLPASRKRLDTVLQEITANPQHTYYQRAQTLQKALHK